MAEIDIVSGFLGAGKTTLIRKLIKEAFCGQQVVLIENEFGEIAIDGGFLQDAGIRITEMNSGCICCTLVGDFKKALEEVIDQYDPDRIIIEPSGVGKLSDVARAVSAVGGKAVLGGKVTVVDANKCKMYLRNFGEFFEDQVRNADVLVLSRTGSIQEAKLLEAAELLKGLNPDAVLITTPWDQLTGRQFLDAMEHRSTLASELAALEEEEHAGEEEESCEAEGPDHDHHHHHHPGEHDADEVFTSWGCETPRKYTRDELEAMLQALDNSRDYGEVLRAKGMLAGESGQWLYFDYVPGESDIRTGTPVVTGRFCVIGSGLKEDALKELFKIG
jgi:G3E family GTPase